VTRAYAVKTGSKFDERRQRKDALPFPHNRKPKKTARQPDNSKRKRMRDKALLSYNCFYVGEVTVLIRM
jgi:hypothetical protein